MALFSIAVVLVMIGVGLWAVNSFIPMDQKIKLILNTVVVLATVFWLLNIFGVFAHLRTIRVG